MRSPTSPWRRFAVALLLGVLATAERASAQAKDKEKDRDESGNIPREYQPPAGMCRVWMDGVPPQQQPAPTDCATAVRNKPANGRVIYGPDKARVRKVQELPVNQLRAPDKKGPPLVPPDISPPDPRIREAWEARKITDEQLATDRPATMSPASSFPGSAPSPQGPSGSYGGYVSAGGAIVPPAADPRYFTPNAPPPGYGSGVCLDRDGDGWCDDQRFGPPVCTDRDKDGRCDDVPAYAARPYPQVLPAMRSALDVIQGRPSEEVLQWLGTTEFIVRVPDQGRGGVPWRAIFLDANNELLQVWTDVTRDGRADRVEIFRGGQRVKLLQR